MSVLCNDDRYALVKWPPRNFWKGGRRPRRHLQDRALQDRRGRQTGRDYLRQRVRTNTHRRAFQRHRQPLRVIVLRSFSVELRACKLLVIPASFYRFLFC